MTQNDEEAFIPRETRISKDMASYIALLTRQASGTIVFRTGAGRIFRDLLIHWPTIEGQEIEAQSLCNRITEAVYPLVGSLYAQAVEISITISPQPITPPDHIDALASYVLFDPVNGLERLFFLSPHHELPSADLMGAREGINVLCRPLNYRYHTIKDDVSPKERVHIGMYELPKRMIDALYEKPSFVEGERTILKIIRTAIHAMPDILKNYFIARYSIIALQSPHVPPHASPGISTVTSLSALPPPVRALEHRIMSYVTNKNYSSELRLGLRRVAQGLRNIYPQATIEEAAQAELAPLAHRSHLTATPRLATHKSYGNLKKASPENFPKTILVGESGKLQKTARASFVQNTSKSGNMQRSKAWAFPTPTLEPFPHAPSSKT